MKRTLLFFTNCETDDQKTKDKLAAKYQVIELFDAGEAERVLVRESKTISAVLFCVQDNLSDCYRILKSRKKHNLLMQIPFLVISLQLSKTEYKKLYQLGANQVFTNIDSVEVLVQCLDNAICVKENAALVNSARNDKLTGLFQRETFFAEAEKLIGSKEAGYYVLSCFDIDNFKRINNQFGTITGDEVLKYIASCLEELSKKVNGICCRYTADKFAMLFPAECVDTDIIKNIRQKMENPPQINSGIKIRIGRYYVNDLSASVNSMFDRATIAEKSIKGIYGEYSATFSEAMHNSIAQEQQIISEMKNALESGEFEAWFQPQYNHSTGALIGAEALVRWNHPDRGLVMPSLFVPIFERNGFIYEVDKFVWCEVCKMLRKDMDEGRKALPVSVNVSRVDIFKEDFFDYITGLIARFQIPFSLLRLEITESAFEKSPEYIVNMVTRLVDYGFTVEIDDFGSGYSSLNTLKDVPAQILKLDMMFLCGKNNNSRAGSIIESVVRMAKWLGMSVIAEGVEEREQADYLQSIGCYIIQGYFYSRPMPLENYRILQTKSLREDSDERIDAVATYDNSAFWNPNSMETMVFNHYSGGAFIFEFRNGQFEMLRINKEFSKTLHTEMSDDDIMKREPFSEISEEDREIVNEKIQNAIGSGKAEICEVRSRSYTKTGEGEFVRLTMRLIARTGSRYLFYGYLENTTAQHVAEDKERLAEEQRLGATQQLEAIMQNITGGISVSSIHNGIPKLQFANDYFYVEYGLTREECEDGTCDPFEQIVPEDRERLVSNTMQSYQYSAPFRTVYRMICPDGKMKWIQASISYIHLAGYDTPVQLAVSTNITERIKAEQREHDARKQHAETAAHLKTIMENVNGGISAFRLESDGDILTSFTNDHFYEMYGYSKEEAQKEHFNLFSNVVSEDLDRVNQFVKEQLIHDRQAGSIEFGCLRKNGERFDVHCNASITNIEGIGDDIVVTVLSDITEEKRAAEALRILNERVAQESQATLEIINGIPGGFLRIQKMADGSYVPITCSEGFKKMLGVDDEMIRASFLRGIVSSVHPEDRDYVKQLVQLLLHTGELSNIKFRMRCGDGSYIWLMLIAKVQKNNKGETFINIYYTDATEIKKNEDMQISLIDNLPCGTALYEFDGAMIKVIHLNKNYWGLVKLNSSEWHDIEVLDAVCPDDRKLVLEELEAAIRQKRDFSSNIRIHYGEEEYRPFHLTGRIVPQTNGHYLIYTIYSPVFNESMSIQGMLPIALSMVMNYSSDFSFIKGSDLHYICCNRFVLELTNEDNERNVIGKSDFDLFPKEMADRHVADDRKILATGEPIVNQEEIITFRDGSIHHGLLSKFPICDSDGTIAGIFGVARDVTQLYEANFELDTLLRVIPSGVLKYSADSKGEFAYVNLKFIEGLGYTQEHFREKFHNCFHELIYLEDREYAEKEIIRQESGGKIGKFNYRIEAADGMLRWYHDEGIKVTDQEGKEWYYVTLVDISEFMDTK